MPEHFEPLVRLGLGAERAGQGDELGAGAADRLGDLGRSLGTRQGNGQRPRRVVRATIDIAIVGLEGQAVEQRGQRIGGNTLRRRAQGQIIAAPIGWEQRHGPPRQRLVVKPQAGLDGGVELERGEPAQRGDRVGFAGQQPQFGADPRPADRFQRAPATAAAASARVVDSISKPSRLA